MQALLIPGMPWQREKINPAVLVEQVFTVQNRFFIQSHP